MDCIFSTDRQRDAREMSKQAASNCLSVRSGFTLHTSPIDFFCLLPSDGIKHAINGVYTALMGGGGWAWLLLRNNKVHGIISRSHGACQQGAEVEKTMCQCVRASITPSPLIAARGALLHSWLIVCEAAAPQLLHAEGGDTHNLFFCADSRGLMNRWVEFVKEQ